jgi:hypothetical protein
VAPPEPPSTSAQDFELHFAWSNERHMREQLLGASKTPAADNDRPYSQTPPEASN